MNEHRAAALRGLEADLGYRFGDLAILDNALTHRSFVNETLSYPCRDNERLEFLGDAVLELFVSALLMKRFPDCAEGELSKRRASIVNERPLADLARHFGLGDLLLLGRGEEASGGRLKPSLLANAFESVVAAIYLDGGFDRTAGVLERVIAPLIETGEASLYRDFKTAAQELCQNRFGQFPRYELLAESGPDHEKHFETGLFVGERLLATGSGRSKKEAEQGAARSTLEALRREAEKDTGPPAALPKSLPAPGGAEPPPDRKR
jgi:ribonuclease III